MAATPKTVAIKVKTFSAEREDAPVLLRINGTTFSMTKIQAQDLVGVSEDIDMDYGHGY